MFVCYLDNLGDQRCHKHGVLGELAQSPVGHNVAERAARAIAPKGKGMAQVLLLLQWHVGANAHKAVGVLVVQVTQLIIKM